MRVALIKPASRCVDDDHLEPPLGLLYLASVARQQRAQEVTLCDLSDCREDSQVMARLDGLRHHNVFGIQAYCTNHEQARQAAAYIRNLREDAYIVVGGPNPTALPQRTLHETHADAVITGEGEDAFADCLESHRGGRPIRGIVEGRGRPDPDTYPLPARDLVVPSSYSRRLLGQPVVSVLSSRGCPHGCAFCNSIVMGGGTRHARFRQPDKVTEEIRGLRPLHRSFRFNDDCLTAHPRLEGLLRGLEDLDVVFRAFARVEDLTPAKCAALRRAGCVHVAVGLESLDPENLRLLGKGRQAGHEDNVRHALNEGIAVRGFFMVGLPNDSDEAIDRHFQAAARLGLTEFCVYPLIPYPGTAIARHPERFGYEVVNPDFRDYVQIGAGRRACFALRHRSFGPEDVARWRNRAEEILERGGVERSSASRIAI